MEKITYIIKGKLPLFQNIWGHFMEYMENVDLSNVGNETDEAYLLVVLCSDPKYIYIFLCELYI